MSPATRDAIGNGLVSGARLGTPTVLLLILYELLKISDKLDAALAVLSRLR